MRKSTRGPSWKEINSLKNVGSKLRMKENNRLKKILNSFGWRHWDHCNILHEGYTIEFVKERNELAYPRLYFSWHYETEFVEDYMSGEMRGFHHYGKPNGVVAEPVGMYEINNIFGDSLHRLLPIMEERMVTALINQTVLE
jgi:hypothetical protein